jgi:nucleoside-diphosphate-sugar epimerase
MVLNKIGLTGSTGMLGSHLKAVLQAAGLEVVSVSRTGADGSAVWDLVEWKTQEALDSMFKEVQVVVHAGAWIPSVSASVNDWRLFDINVRACANIAQWALSKDVPLIFISSSTVYADSDKTPLKEDAPLGWNSIGGFYGMSKLLAEDILERFRLRGLRTAIVRPSALFGFGGPKTKMIYRFLDTAVRDDVISLTSSIHDSVDFIHAADLSSAIVKIIEKNFWYTINIASGRQVSIYDLAKSCVNVAGSGKVEVGDLDQTNVPIKRFFLDTKMAQNKLGWTPTIEINEGLSMVLSERLIPIKSYAR